MAHSRTFTRESVRATVHLRHRSTPYRTVGDWVGYLGLLVMAYSLTPKRYALPLREPT